MNVNESFRSEGTNDDDADSSATFGPNARSPGTRTPEEPDYWQTSIEAHNKKVTKGKRGDKYLSRYFTSCNRYLAPELVESLGFEVSIPGLLLQGSGWLTKRLEKNFSESNSASLTHTQSSFQLGILICRYIETIHPGGVVKDLPLKHMDMVRALNENQLIMSTNKMRMEKLPPFSGSHKDWTIWSNLVVQQMKLAGF